MLPAAVVRCGEVITFAENRDGRGEGGSQMAQATKSTKEFGDTSCLRRLTLATVWGDRIWDFNAGSQLAVLHHHDDWIRTVAWSPNGRWLVTALRDRTVRILDVDSGDELAALNGHDSEVRGLEWSSDGRRLATGSDDQTVRIWNADTGAEIIVVGAHLKGVEDVSWSPDGERIASGHETGPAGYGMRPPVSKIWWPMRAVASPGN